MDGSCLGGPEDRTTGFAWDSMGVLWVCMGVTRFMDSMGFLWVDTQLKIEISIMLEVVINWFINITR